MFSVYQEREEYEDELYAEEEHADDSEPDSDVEFRLYSQLHYCTDDLENHPENYEENSGHETPQEPQPGQRVQPPAAPPDEVILIDSDPDIITLSDNTEEDDSVCARKGQRSKGKGVAPISQHQHQSEAVRNEVVVLDSESGQSSDSESILPYVVDPDLDSDSDGLESWMILGREKEEGDQDIQLNVFAVRKREYSEFDNVRGDEKNWAVSDKDKEAQIYNKGVGSRRVSNRYYTEKTVTCHNCNKLGHLSKSCPTPKKAPCCLLCGFQGHFLKTCPNRHCSNCALPGHTYDDCLERAYWHKRCHRCAMTGHFADACPDVWRQYHLTTRPGPPVKSLHPEAHRSPGYCYNCSRMGHFGHECKERRMFNGTYPSLPFASSYDTVHDIKRREHRAHLQAKELREAGLLDEAEAAPTPQPPWKKAKNTHFHQVPHTHSSAHTPKRRIAHTPKHPPRTTPKPNTHLRWNEDTPVPKNKKKKNTMMMMNTPGPISASTPRFESKKKTKNKKQKINIMNEEQDFPRSFQKSPYNKGERFQTPPYRGRKSSGVLFGSEKSKKKKNKEEKRARKAARDTENLFLIKQRKRSR
ncbi:zinc finger CCHC domain-containing protein 7 [Tachysurus fulvidraco]|uniref:zinc finger CCHC domain-containing protein 7 n=1 Tax=Tachysurus fulvidraco TaxID=1234273 RepID=UPI000F4E664E|nr:zinc finger CCHC domain-containing protein 7 [Tachysurus fulvidraco]XP_047672667.1 zinc finger CCHC domain-containing protein 7 [Tachysurus fulvidraco]XP_047672668.1 zinc finger CCHC domain-containing protein 7 [Tachysurus fulvidraco]